MCSYKGIMSSPGKFLLFNPLSANFHYNGHKVVVTSDGSLRAFVKIIFLRNHVTKHTNFENFFEKKRSKNATVFKRVDYIL